MNFVLVMVLCGAASCHTTADPIPSAARCHSLASLAEVRLPDTYTRCVLLSDQQLADYQQGRLQAVEVQP